MGVCHDESLVKRVKGHFVTRLLGANYEKHPVQLDKLLEAGKSYHLQRKCRTPPLYCDLVAREHAHPFCRVLLKATQTTEQHEF